MTASTPSWITSLCCPAYCPCSHLVNEIHRLDQKQHFVFVHVFLFGPSPWLTALRSLRLVSWPDTRSTMMWCPVVGLLPGLDAFTGEIERNHTHASPLPPPGSFHTDLYLHCLFFFFPFSRCCVRCVCCVSCVWFVWCVLSCVCCLCCVVCVVCCVVCLLTPLPLQHRVHDCCQRRNCEGRVLLPHHCQEASARTGDCHDEPSPLHLPGSAM